MSCKILFEYRDFFFLPVHCNFASFDFICLSIGACRQQDEELDELSASVERIGGVGLTIHEELLAQVRIFLVVFPGNVISTIDPRISDGKK
jgi:hypothetical protein